MEVKELQQLLATQLVIFGTGHRPVSKVQGRNVEKIPGGWADWDRWVADEVGTHNGRIEKLTGGFIGGFARYAKGNGQQLVVVTGGALGFDMLMQRAALKAKKYHRNIVVVSAVPFTGYNDNWYSQSSKALVDRLNELSDAVVVVSEKPDPLPNRWVIKALDDRNKFMVDVAKFGIALHDGTPGGTRNCLNYATKNKKKCIVIDPVDLSYLKNGKRYLECSTAGTGPSAMTAMIDLPDGSRLSIERVYQAAKLGADKRPYANPKGKQAKYMQFTNGRIYEGSTQTAIYTYLWCLYFRQNPNKLNWVGEYEDFSDMFAGKKSVNSQADVIRDIVARGLNTVECEALKALVGKEVR